MNHLRAIIGAAVLSSALVLCLIGAGSASATTLHVCTSEEIFQQTTPRYEDSKCRIPNASGSFHLTRLNVNAATSVSVENEGLHTLSATIAGVTFTIVCEAQTGSGILTNVETGGVMGVVGKEILLKYSKCKVTAPAGKGCAVKKGEFETKKLKSTLPAMTEAEATKVKLEPESGELAIVTVESCTIAGLNGEKPVKGFAQGVVPEADQSLLEFSSTTGSSLTFGGQAATYTGKTRSFMAGTAEPLFLAKP